MNYLGVDYGEKRIGLAKANDELKIATPLVTIGNEESVFDKLAEITAEESIDKIVVGLPVSFDGREKVFAKKIRVFASRLGEITDCPVVLENEIFSSKMARESSPQKPDESAAAVILQGYMDRVPHFDLPAER